MRRNDPDDEQTPVTDAPVEPLVDPGFETPPVVEPTEPPFDPPPVDPAAEQPPGPPSLDDPIPAELAELPVLYYLGDGEQHIAGIPPRDLTLLEVAGLEPSQRRDATFPGPTGKPLYGTKPA